MSPVPAPTPPGPLVFYGYLRQDLFHRLDRLVADGVHRWPPFDISHPDVLEFIRAKREDGRLRQFNLSLLITTEFMEAVRQDEEWVLSFPIRRGGDEV